MIKRTIVPVLVILILALATTAFSQSALQGRYLSLAQTTYRTGEEVILSWFDTPGNQQDWVSVVPAGSRDNLHGSWTYTKGQTDGFFEVRRLTPGEYEARIYFNWPEGRYEVIERLHFRVLDAHEIHETQGMQEDERALVRISGSIDFEGDVEIEMGLQPFSLVNPVPYEYIAFGGTTMLEPLFTFRFGESWAPDHEEQIRAFLEETGKTSREIDLFMLLDYEGQILLLHRTLFPETDPLSILLQSQESTEAEVVSKLPSEVHEAILGFRKNQDAEFILLDLIITEKQAGDSIEVGYGTGKARLNRCDESEGFWPTYCGSLTASFQTGEGQGEIELSFSNLSYNKGFHVDTEPYRIQLSQWGVTTTIQSWNPHSAEPSVSFLEKIWEEFYPIDRVSVKVVNPNEAIAHSLRVWLLREGNRWEKVWDMPLAESFDPSIEHRILPEPITACGIRFELEGIPFMGESWQLMVHSAPYLDLRGTVSKEWRYFHVW